MGAYALLAACTQMLWLSFAAIDTDVAGVLHIDAGTVGDLAAVFPGVYIVLALPTGRWLDLRFLQAFSTGAVLTGGGALLRLVAPASFGWLLAGQLVIACGQPLVLNAINKIAARHFPAGERATAIAIGSAALFAGILASVLSAGPLFATGGLRLLLEMQAAATLAAAALALAALRTPPLAAEERTPARGLRWLAGDRFMWLLAALVFIGMGTYNAIATYLQPILQRFNQGDAAGNLIALMTFAGIAGAATLAPAVAARDRRRAMLVAALAMTAVTFAAIAVGRNVLWSGAWLFAEGFVLLASLPVVLDWSENHAGPQRQGAAVGFLMLAGNLGGLVLVLLTQLVVGNAYLALGLLATVALAGVPVALRLPARTAAVRSARDQLDRPAPVP